MGKPVDSPPRMRDLFTDCSNNRRGTLLPYRSHLYRSHVVNIHQGNDHRYTIIYALLNYLFFHYRQVSLYLQLEYYNLDFICVQRINCYPAWPVRLNHYAADPVILTTILWTQKLCRNDTYRTTRGKETETYQKCNIQLTKSSDTIITFLFTNGGLSVMRALRCHQGNQLPNHECIGMWDIIIWWWSNYFLCSMPLINGLLTRNRYYKFAALTFYVVFLSGLKLQNRLVQKQLPW